MSQPTSTLTSYRILDDKELEGLRWRKDIAELRTNTLFGNQQKFPTPFLKEKKEKKETK
jgi:hypothetical protein